MLNLGYQCNTITLIDGNEFGLSGAGLGTAVLESGAPETLSAADNIYRYHFTMPVLLPKA